MPFPARIFVENLILNILYDIYMTRDPDEREAKIEDLLALIPGNIRREIEKRLKPITEEYREKEAELAQRYQKFRYSTKEALMAERTKLKMDYLRKQLREITDVLKKHGYYITSKEAPISLYQPGF